MPVRWYNRMALRILRRVVAVLVEMRAVYEGMADIPNAVQLRSYL